MGAINNDDYPRYLYASSMADRRVSKQVHDNVHGNIYLDPVRLLQSLSLSLIFIYVCISIDVLCISEYEFTLSCLLYSLLLFFLRSYL